jgi:hypothetical protein
MPVPFTFGTATAAIPLSQLDTNFATAITLGNTAMYLGNTTTSVGNLTLTNVTISSGTANVTANITYGTANAVVYSNASNVGTTSANLTFNGTTLTSTGFSGPLNGTVGATTPASGAFTTVSASGVATFSAGTVSLPAITTTGDTNTGIFFPAADTIAFTEGGVESMRIDSSGNVGIGTSSPSGKLDVVLTDNGNIDIRQNASASTGFLSWVDSNGDRSGRISYDHGTDALRFGTAPGGTALERMRITSSGDVGVGTSSPAVKLDVAGNATVQNGVLTVGKDTVYDAFINTPESMYFNVDSDGNSTGNRFVWGTDRAGNTGGTEWMRLDSSGNLGLGVTPSAWFSGSKVLQINNAAFEGISDANITYANAYRDSSGSAWKYIASNLASRYIQTSGAHQWFNAPSGTAGNAITWTQAMTLDASGNLGIGNTNNSALLHVGKVNQDGDVAVMIGNGATSSFTASTATLQFRQGGNGGATLNAGKIVSGRTGNYSSSADADSFLAFYTALDNTDTERARFNSTGAFVFAGGTTTADGIGITFPATQSASTNANTLDDYEEGTWTPNQGSGLTVVGAFSSAGVYTKIGNLVYVRGYVQGATSIAIAAGGVLTSNLPFSNGTDACGGNCTNYSVNQTSGIYIQAGTTANATSAITASQQVIFGFTYRV